MKDNKGVDIEKIAGLLTDGAEREDNYLQKIAELESEIANLKAEKEANSISFSQKEIHKEASLNEYTGYEMGSVDNDIYLEETLSGRDKLNNFLETLQ